LPAQLEDAVRRERLEFAFSGMPVSLAVSVVLAVLTAYMLRSAAGLGVLGGWLGALAAINGLRGLHCRRFWRDVRRGEVDHAAYDRQLLLSCLIGGLVWGASALLFLPSAPELQFFLAFVIAGISSGAASSLSVAPRAAYAFVIPCVLPLACRFLIAGDALHRVMGVMTGVYLVLVTLVARRGHSQLQGLVASQLQVQHSQAALDRSEVQRQASDERLRVAAEAGQIGVWEWDLSSGDIIWDERMFRLYALEPCAERRHYEMWLSRLHPADRARTAAQLNLAIEGQGEFKSEFRILLPSGEERFIKAAAAVTRDARGVALRMTGINVDITEVRRLERVKSEFVSVVSHELRTPLTSIRGSLGLVLNPAGAALPESSRSLLDIARRNAERLGVLIDDLLDVEKLEAGKLRLQLQQQPIEPLIQQALESNTPYAAQHGVRLELSMPGQPQLVLVDGQRLIQVVTNLLSNAVKFSPRDTVVEIAVTCCTPDRVRVSVRDRGPGIPTEFRTRIFTKFSQADASDARNKGGTGLGLAISRGLIEQMGGMIDLELPEDGGSRFYFELPLKGC
jgi:signal transduction histidine kinase